MFQFVHQTLIEMCIHLLIRKKALVSCIKGLSLSFFFLKELTRAIELFIR